MTTRVCEPGDSSRKLVRNRRRDTAGEARRFVAGKSPAPAWRTNASFNTSVDCFDWQA
jgi:hypothetical protein